MSVERRDRVVMPQPEQWMSEHPLWSLLVFGALFAVVFIAGVWAA